MAKAKDKKSPKAEAKAEAPPTPKWVVYTQQPHMEAGPMTFGPFGTPNGPMKVRLEPGVPKRVNGHWAEHARKSSLGPMLSFTEKEPKPKN